MQDVKDTRYVWNAWESVLSSLCFHYPHLLVGFLFSQTHIRLLPLPYPSPSWRADIRSNFWMIDLVFCFLAGNISSKLELFHGNKFFLMKFCFSRCWGPIWTLLSRYRWRMFLCFIRIIMTDITLRSLKGRTIFKSRIISDQWRLKNYHLTLQIISKICLHPFFCFVLKINWSTGDFICK